MSRSEPWAEPPDGFHFEVVADTEWITPPTGAGRCRYTVGPGHRICGAAPVATLMRGFRPARPWDYCAEHLYGRWIEDGRVVGWWLVRDAGGG